MNEDGRIHTKACTLPALQGHGLPTVHEGDERSALERRLARDSDSVRKVLLAAEPGERSNALATMLGGEGYQVVVVGDGFELLNAWTFAWLASSAQPFGVIVTDGPMPLLSGPEAILELRQFSDCRAACVTAVGGPDQDPLDPDEVLSQVRSAFSRESRRKKRAAA